ncbi:fluconazole resistance protein 1 [Aspergillus udagawae]|nr:fluconazole resistance protein 1 [Aspergillus udagawae]
MRSGSARKRPSDADDHCPATHGARRRISRACDRCRAQKARCDGGKPCIRCGDNVPCVYQEKKPLRRKYPAGYVDMLEEHQAYLITGLRKLYGCIQQDAKLPEVDRDGNNRPIVHELLDKLGIFEEPVKEHRSSMTESKADADPFLGSLNKNGILGGATTRLPESSRAFLSTQEVKPSLASNPNSTVNVPRALRLPNHIPLNTGMAQQRCARSRHGQAGAAGVNRRQPPVDLSNGFWRWSFDFSDFLAVSSRDEL